MKSRLYSLAALSMAIGVACGAFGAHGLRNVVSAGDLQIWEKAVFYQLVHGIAVLQILTAPCSFLSDRAATRLAALFLVGTLIFSGTLYVLVLADMRWLGMITPIGGSCFILGWCLVALYAVRAKGRQAT